jgi:hypothetical protein
MHNGLLSKWLHARCAVSRAQQQPAAAPRSPVPTRLPLAPPAVTSAISSTFSTQGDAGRAAALHAVRGWLAEGPTPLAGEGGQGSYHAVQLDAACQIVAELCAVEALKNKCPSGESYWEQRRQGDPGMKTVLPTLVRSAGSATALIDQNCAFKLSSKPCPLLPRPPPATTAVPLAASNKVTRITRIWSQRGACALYGGVVQSRSKCTGQ